MFSHVFVLALGFASIVQSAPLPNSGAGALEIAAAQLLPRSIASYPVLARRDSSYTVVSGDTGDSIAQEEGITFDQLSACNPGVTWTNLQIGQVLSIPSATTYTVVSGDTGDSIAQAEGVTFDQLSAANPGVTWTNLQIGQVLNIPSGSGATTSTTTAASTTFTTAATTTTVVGSSAAATTVATSEAATSAAATTAEATTTAVPQKAPTTTPVVSVATSSAAASSAASSASATAQSSSVASIATLTGSLAVSSVNDQDSSAAGSDSYTQYTGDGSTSAGWPSMSDWASFDDMWSNNEAIFGKCVSSWGVADNTADETAAVKSAIEAVAAASAVDHRFILATIMQESGGCVRVPTTNWGVNNPGLMQDHNGAGTCNEGGTIQTPCPSSQITQMIIDGVMGTVAQSGGGDGSVQVITEAQTQGGSGAQAFYMAARIYNSGSIASGGDLGAGGSTHCYASDVANRLTGWATAATKCTLN